MTYDGLGGGRFEPGLYLGIRRLGGRDHRRPDVVWNLFVHAAGAASGCASRTRKGKLEALYSDFIEEAARLLGDSLTRQTDDVINLVRL
jgi:hypothetical protein